MIEYSVKNTFINPSGFIYKIEVQKKEILLSNEVIISNGFIFFDEKEDFVEIYNLNNEILMNWIMRDISNVIFTEII